MSYTSTGLTDASLEEDDVGPTTDVWADRSDQLSGQSQMTRSQHNRNGWAIPVPRNVSAFDAVDAPEHETVSEIGCGELQEVLVILPFPEKAAWLLHSPSQVTALLPYLAPESLLHGLAYQRSSSSPDFLEFRRYARYVMGSSPASTVEWEQASESEQNVAVTIQPEVIREAERNALTDDLKVGIKLARRTYPTLSRIDVTVEDDPEIADWRTLRFVLTVSGDPEAILRNEDLFKQRLHSSTALRTRELITVTYRWGE
jgi:hypothetical protein